MDYETNLESRKESINEQIKFLESSQVPVVRVLYSAAIKIDWDLEQIPFRKIEEKVKEMITEEIKKNPSLQLPVGKYHFRIAVEDNKLKLVDFNFGGGPSYEDWERKKDFSLRKFREIGIPFVDKTDKNFDTWALGEKKYNVHFTHHDNWYGISTKAIDKGFDFIFINSDFEFCVLDNLFIRKHKDKFYPTNRNLNQLTFTIDWLSEQINGYSEFPGIGISNRIGVIGIKEYNHFFSLIF